MEGTVTVLLKNTISSVIFHTKNWKIITSMHKWILGFTNMSEASKGIRVSHIVCGDLSSTLSECSIEKERPSFSIHQKHCPLKSLLILPCTRHLFSKYTLFRLLIFRFNPSLKDFLHHWHEKKLELLKAELCPPKRNVKVLTSSTCESDFIWE